MNLEKRVLTTAVLGTFILGTGLAHAAQVTAYAPITSTDNNFTFLDSLGGIVGGTNDVAFTWDGTVYTASSDYTGPGGTSNATLSSPTPFFGHTWAAHDIQIFAPGSYSFDTTLGGGNTEIGTLNMNVGGNQLGAHLLWDWNGNLNIDVAMVWDKNTTFTGNLFTGATNPSGNNASTVWMLTSGDGNGDGVNGIPMAVGGPLSGMNINFNVKGTLAPVPIPAALWLFGPALIGLFGLARKRTRSQ